MQLTRIIKRFEKHNFVVKPQANHTTKWVVKNPTTGSTLEFFENGRGSGDVQYFTARHPDTDASVDLFMDTYIHTIRAAVHHLELTP